jgi:hypothetical protein
MEGKIVRVQGGKLIRARARARWGQQGASLTVTHKSCCLNQVLHDTAEAA